MIEGILPGEFYVNNKNLRNSGFVGLGTKKPIALGGSATESMIILKKSKKYLRGEIVYREVKSVLHTISALI